MGGEVALSLHSIAVRLPRSNAAAREADMAMNWLCRHDCAPDTGARAGGDEGSRQAGVAALNPATMGRSYA